MDERKYAGPKTIVPVRSAFAAYSDENDGAQSTPDMIAKLSTQPTSIFMACCALPSYDLHGKKIEHGLSCAGCQLALQDGISTRSGDWAGFVRDMVYSQDGFLKHFE